MWLSRIQRTVQFCLILAISLFILYFARMCVWRGAKSTKKFSSKEMIDSELSQNFLKVHIPRGKISKHLIEDGEFFYKRYRVINLILCGSNPPHSVLIIKGNLHPACNESVLYKKFSVIGKVSSVKVCRDSKTANSLGYGYVNFVDKEHAKTAIESMCYDLLFNRAVRVMWADKNRTKYPAAANLVVKNLDEAKSELDLREIFSQFGDTVSIKVAKNRRGNSKGYAFVQFSEQEAAEKAMSALNNTEVDEKTLTVTRYIPAEERLRYQQSMFPNNIYIANLSAITKDELTKMCEAFGDVVSTKVVSKGDTQSNVFAFVSFKERSSAMKAITELNRLCLNGQQLSAGFAVRRKTVYGVNN